MLPMLLYNSLAAQYKTLDECYGKPSSAKVNIYNACVKGAADLKDVFRPEFSVKCVYGITGFSCMKFTFTTDIYVELPVYNGQIVAGAAYVLACRRIETKDHTRYSFSHVIYRMPNAVLLRLFDICPDDISYYYSYAQQTAMRREVGELI